MSRKLMKDGRPRSPFSMVTMTIFVILWTIPTIGLLVTSFRKPIDINRSGWWTSFTHPGDYTLSNYQQALAPGSSAGLAQYFVNTIVITIPAVILPIGVSRGEIAVA